MIFRLLFILAVLVPLNALEQIGHITRGRLAKIVDG